ncbi:MULTISPECIES: hypothetical protein [Nonomuraea]|uniref:hypothetical protein n=1 Tax=Nonomuraea TaxID=83681 RepID=UPI001C5DAA22|nr:hypothetical protein [Nonomuraea ceibae]
MGLDEPVDGGVERLRREGEGKPQVVAQGAVGREMKARGEEEIAGGREGGQPAGVGVEEFEPQRQAALRGPEAAPRQRGQAGDQMVALGAPAADDRLLERGRRRDK